MLPMGAAKSCGNRRYSTRQSPTTQRLNNSNLVINTQRTRQIKHLLAVNKDTHVPAHMALLVNHAKAYPRVIALQIVEQRSQRCTVRADTCTVRIRAQSVGDADVHRHTPLQRC